MGKFYLEEPTLERKQEAIKYITEHFDAGSDINGSGSLDSWYEDYEGWLEKLELEKNQETCPPNRSPGRTYFLIRESDNKIVGMANLRYPLTDDLSEYGGNIGYGIRPAERGKGYSKVLLYLVLQKCKEVDLEKVLITADDNNPASWRTILALGGILENKVPNKYEDGGVLRRYWVDVNKSLEKHKELIN